MHISFVRSLAADTQAPVGYWDPMGMSKETTEGMSQSEGGKWYECWELHPIHHFFSTPQDPPQWIDIIVNQGMGLLDDVSCYLPTMC